VQLDDAVKVIPQVVEIILIGGVGRTLRVQFDFVALIVRGFSSIQFVFAFQQVNR
jgi:hypothetical protein